MHARKRTVILCLAPLLCAVPAFSQAIVSIPDADGQGEKSAILVQQNTASEVTPAIDFNSIGNAYGSPDSRERRMFDLRVAVLPAPDRNGPNADTAIEPIVEKSQSPKPADFSREVYYRNKLEFSLDVGWHPINIPFPLDVFVGDDYNTYPLKYTLVPIVASLRWHVNGVSGPPVLRGNFDVTFSGSVTAIPRGPETRYYSYDMGIRRNFVPHRGRVDPYWDVRLGVGNIDAKGPLGVKYAQGQDITFTINMGSGVRYNFSPRYALSAGFNFMHISNLDLSESNGKPNWGVRNYGINVLGPMVGLDIQLRRHQQESAH